MQAYVSLWSADLLDVGRAIDLVAPVADGFHLDVFDGHNVDDLLFGPDFVAAVRRRTTVPLEVHLNVDDPDRWAPRFVDVGADVVTVQSSATPDVDATLALIREHGAQAGLGVEVHEAVATAAGRAERTDRFLLMGTPIGIKGLPQDPAAPQRVAELVRLLALAGSSRPVFVDGGIRPGVVAALATAGATGVVPGSLVFGSPDPVAAIERLHTLPAADVVPAGNPPRPLQPQDAPSGGLS